ncbi:hypothetical protein [Listeria phage vB_Lmo_3274]
MPCLPIVNILFVGSFNRVRTTYSSRVLYAPGSGFITYRWSRWETHPNPSLILLCSVL